MTARWERAGFQVVLGECGSGPWVKADAVRNALAATNADVFAVADADVWGDGIVEATARVVDGAPWAIPHTPVHRLTREATAQVLAGTEPTPDMPVSHVGGLITAPYHGVAGGGIVVVRREVYEDCPIDPRFNGWGQEDEAWALALRALYGRPVRLAWPLWHLWHPPQPKAGLAKSDSHPSMVLFKRYVRAVRRPEQMRDLLAEVREVTPC